MIYQPKCINIQSPMAVTETDRIVSLETLI